MRGSGCALFIFQGIVMGFAENFKSLRKNAGLTQQQVADALGIDRSAIAHYEKGDSKPTFENILKICKMFEITLEELISK